MKMFQDLHLNILEYFRLEYVIAMLWNHRVFKVHSMHDVQLEYSYRIYGGIPSVHNVLFYVPVC